MKPAQIPEPQAISQELVEKHGWILLGWVECNSGPERYKEAIYKKVENFLRILPNGKIYRITKQPQDTSIIYDEVMTWKEEKLTRLQEILKEELWKRYRQNYCY